MFNSRILLLCSLFVVFLSGCTVPHPIVKDYPKYLSENKNHPQLPKSDVSGQYVIAPNTAEHRYEFRAASVGYAHIWIVEFGKILDETLQQAYVQNAFGTLNKREANGSIESLLFEFELSNYEYKNYRAYVGLTIKLTKQGETIYKQTYNVEGDFKGGQMWFGGPFAMTSATLTSNKSAIDKILMQFINDINKSEVGKLSAKH